jgi:Phage portal protein
MSDDLIKIQTERGQGRALSPSDANGPFSGLAPGTGSDWFGPLQPIPPIAPEEVAGRSWDFAPGWNLTTQPRGFEPVSFHALRNLAEAFDPVRLIIERRKDQMVRVPWAIRPKHEGQSKRPKAAQLPAPMRERIADITALFKRPSYGETFRSWLRAILEDLLVLDAPSIYLKRDVRGEVVSLQWLDGATIKRVIDDWGRTPEPIPDWNGAPFDWMGQIVTSDNFRQLGFTVQNGFLWKPAYQQVLKGLAAVNYSTNDLIYRPLNMRPGKAYGYSPVEQIMVTVSIAMRRAHSQLAYFTEGNQPDAIYSLPPTWTPDQVQRFQDYWDALYSGNLANRRKMKFAPDGDYTALKDPQLKGEIDEWLIRIVCFAFSYPPSAFVTLSNRSIADQHEHASEEEGLGVLKQWSKEVLDEIIEHQLGEDELEFAWLEDEEVDQEKQSTILRGYATDGILTINEVRERLGEEPSTDPAANSLRVKTATGYVPIGDVEPELEVDVAEKSTFAPPATATTGLGGYPLLRDWIKLKPPKALKPVPKRIRLTSGITICPDINAGGLARLPTEEDAAELERDGWTRA